MLIDFQRAAAFLVFGRIPASGSDGLIRLGGRSEEEEEEDAILAEEDAAILAAERPSVADDLADLAARLLPVHRPHRKWRR